jgi:hypothetical protein
MDASVIPRPTRVSRAQMYQMIATAGALDQPRPARIGQTE